MDVVLTAAAMREADRYAIEEYGMPGFTLMETAGRGAARRIELRYGPLRGRTVACYCGKGNNGGDGLVVARLLYQRGARVHALLVDEERMTEDTAQNLRLLRRLAEHDDEDRLRIARFAGVDRLPAADLHVDALLGTGLASDLREPIRGMAAWLGRRPEPVVALDVPTGLQSDDGRILGVAVRADLTVTMGAYKAGLLVGDGPAVAGQIDVVEIGIPAFVLEAASGEPGCAVRTTGGAVRGWLPERAHDAHKYGVGLGLVVGGAAGMTGAPAMSATAAARAGAGYVACACAASLQPTLAAKLTEITTVALPEADDGGIAPGPAIDALLPRLEKARALLVGPGLGRAESTQRFIRALLKEAGDLPVVIDADGLNALAGHTELLERHAGGRWVLTPHMGEFKRLAGADVDVRNRIRTTQAYAQRWNCVLVLKGLPSVTACPEGRAYVNGTGNPALATAGTGDVLAGICTGLMAQGVPPERAAVAALHLGGAAADRYASLHAARSMMALDLLDHLPDVLHDLSHEPLA